MHMEGKGKQERKGTDHRIETFELHLHLVVQAILVVVAISSSFSIQYMYMCSYICLILCLFLCTKNQTVASWCLYPMEKRFVLRFTAESRTKGKTKLNPNIFSCMG